MMPLERNISGFYRHQVYCYCISLNLNQLQVTSNNRLHFSLGCICTIDFNLLQSILLLSLLERILRPQNQEYMLAVSSHSRLSKLSLLP